MNDQLKRIRQKDYNSIDQKLFENMTRADNLNSTLSHLSQFQKFLLEQINCMNQPLKAKANYAIANNISKNFESLRESLVKCSQVIGESDRKSVVNLKKNFNSLLNLVKGLKKDIYQQIRQTCKNVQEQAKKSMQQLIILWTKQKDQKEQYVNRCTNLQQEKNQLLKRIEQLTIIIQKNNEKNIIRDKIQQPIIPLQNSINLNNSNHQTQKAEKVVNQFQTEAPVSYTPLKQKIKNQVICYDDRSWKIVKESFDPQQRKISNSRQHSSHKLPSKSFINMAKQNQLLARKGIKQQRGKSRQKIKLVSMM